jgi:putative hemolysin
MSSDLIIELAVIVALVLANALFSGAEIALVTVRTSRLEELADQGNRSALAALTLKRQPERLLATIQVGITVISATAAAVGGASVADRLAPWVARVPWLREHAEEIALGIVIALVSYLSIVIGELVPKSIALRSAERYAMLAARPLLAVSTIVRPIVNFLTMSSNVVLKPFGDRTTFIETRYSTEEIQQLVEQAKNTGTLHPNAAEIASRALVFPELSAQEVMVPRHEVVMLPLKASMEEIYRIIISRPHTRLPVYDESPDDVVGYINIKDLATRSWERGTIALEDVMRPPHFVPASKMVADLLTEMRQQHVPIAIVIEEQGGLAGVITIEDLIEELVGTIVTEHGSDVQRYVRDRDGSWLVSGSLPIRELNRELNLDLPEEGDWNTLAGLYIHRTGHIPKPGEKERLENGTELEVLDASPRRIRTLRVRSSPEALRNTG